MSTKTRATWIGAAFAAAWLCAIPSLAQERVVSVTDGQVARVLSQGVVSFKGIPFAAPPVGDLRWRAPQTVPPWSGVLKADHFAASCLQTVAPRGFGPWTHEYVVQGPVSEDCLYLNIWTPARHGTHLPVLLYIHGGAFLQGSGSVSVYDGAALALRGIVVVTVNYRLGVLGFLAHPELTREAHGAPPGNYRAIAQSGGGARPSGFSLAQAERIGKAFARSRGATSLAALRALTPEQLSVSRQGPNPQFSPIVDGVLLPRSPCSRASACGSSPPMARTRARRFKISRVARRTPERGRST
jgi:para-nitrobenzyl esterase